ncbi:hypothetical protein N6T38_00005, partial [Pseudomonas aeruginosa]
HAKALAIVHPSSSDSSPIRLCLRFNSAARCRMAEGRALQGFRAFCVRLLPCHQRGFSLPFGEFFARLEFLLKGLIRTGLKLMGDD